MQQGTMGRIIYLDRIGLGWPLCLSRFTHQTLKVQGA